jgi:hypothetical protein
MNQCIQNIQTANIKDMFHSIQYRAYLQEAFGWKDYIIDRIWWPPLEKSLQELTQGELTTMHKFMHKRLLCNKKEHRYYPYLSSECKLCPNTEETQQHVLKCKCCSKRNELRTKYIKQVRYEMRLLKTNENTTRVLPVVKNIEAYLEDQREPNIREIVENPSTTLIQAISDQHQLGWDQFFCGRISEKWARLYQPDVQNMENPDRKNNVDYWGKKIVGLTYRFVLESWKIRNDTEYNDEDPDSETTSKKKLIKKIMWNIEKIGNKINHSHQNVTTEKLNILPMGKLESMDEQLVSIVKLTKTRNGNEGS